jgi:hypothetical protein
MLRRRQKILVRVQHMTTNRAPSEQRERERFQTGRAGVAETYALKVVRGQAELGGAVRERFTVDGTDRPKRHA